MRTELIGLNGGRKQFWLRVHRSEVVTFYHANGIEETLKEFNLLPRTLESLLAGSGQPHAMTNAQRALAISEMAIDGTRELRREVKALEARVEAMRPMAQVFYGVIAAVRQISQLPLPREDNFEASRKNEAD